MRVPVPPMWGRACGCCTCRPRRITGLGGGVSRKAHLCRLCKDTAGQGNLESVAPGVWIEGGACALAQQEGDPPQREYCQRAGVL